MSDVMYNNNGKKVGIVDNEFEKVDVSKFNDLNIGSENVQIDMFGSITTTLSYEDNKEFIDDVYAKYLSDKAEWLNAADMETQITVRDDDTVHISVSAEQFISSDNINTAYVESHDLKDEKGNIVRDKLISAAKEKGYEIPNIRPQNSNCEGFSLPYEEDTDNEGDGNPSPPADARVRLPDYDDSVNNAENEFDDPFVEIITGGRGR